MVRAVKGTLTFDPNDYDYGPATMAIRTIIVEWADIDWFVPSSASDEEMTRLFDEHNALAHRRAPELFPERVTTRCVQGGWSEFVAWCKRVREQTRWDWRFSILKKLSHDHAKACGWSLDAQAAHVPKGQPKPGDLFFRFDDANGKASVIWNGLLPADSSLQAISNAPAKESAQFYFGHAQADAFNCVRWQLAENHADVTANPFVPLARCYRAGAYPFSLDRDTVVLFRFTADEHVLPRATLLPKRS